MVIPLPAAYLQMYLIAEIVDNIVKKHPKQTIALISRKKCQLIPFQVLFAKKNINFKIDDELNILDGTTFKDFLEILSLPTIKNENLQPHILYGYVCLLAKYFFRYFPSCERFDSLFKFINKIIVQCEIKIQGNGKKKIQISSSLESTLLKLKDWEEYFLKKGDVEEFVRIANNFIQSKSVLDALKNLNFSFKGLSKSFAKSKSDIFFVDPPFSFLIDLAVEYKDNFRLFISDLKNASKNISSALHREHCNIELMTALRAKGREFNTVFILDTNDEIWPNKLAKRDGFIEEERRLFYVAMTRAKNNLIFFHTQRIDGIPFSPSPFLTDAGIDNKFWLEGSNFEKISSNLFKEFSI